MQVKKLNKPCNTRDMEVLCAVPYNQELSYFYFSSSEEYEVKLQAAKQIDLIEHFCGDFEHEVQYIDGDTGSQELFDKCSSVEEYFEIIDEIQYQSGEKLAAFQYLIDCLHKNPNDALAYIDDIHITTDSIEDYAHDLIQEMELPDIAKQYFDYQSYGRDLEINGEICTFEFNGTQYLITNSNAY
ncbi:antirestriction protein ArdA [Endozoicomonas sp. SCSIO W0465]|uniref:antirestriction protein ArdA n=1 Tax=Endozoicomonas sp. SCSIO W0465 TaxID=2918516 RepID=UPI0020764188|nr:antirestriction protein ArdA [Endozoicomonas sp. SCSIO W0465]USE39535.1 antirestriction protein ArdA [Endozoicomonas sp. SCSIO W0465]